MKNAIELIKNDHQEVKKLFQDFERAGKDDYIEKQAFAEKITRELSMHADIEEELLYPFLEKISDDEMGETLVEAREEHHVARSLIDELKMLTPDAEEFDAKMKVLRDNVLHHIEGEEKELLPYLQDNAEEIELTELGERLKTAKEELLVMA